MWKVIDDKDTLKLNDVIKLGRFRFKLVDMITDTFDKEQKEGMEKIIQLRRKVKIPVKYAIQICNLSIIR